MQAFSSKIYQIYEFSISFAKLEIAKVCACCIIDPNSSCYALVSIIKV